MLQLHLTASDALSKLWNITLSAKIMDWIKLLDKIKSMSWMMQ